MEAVLRESLRDGEKVRWQGEPVRFSLLDDADRTTILVKWIATAVLAVGLLVVYIPSRETPSVGFIGLVALTAVLIMGSPLIERWSLKQQRYWITNQRVILMTRDKSLYSMELGDIDGFQVAGGRAPEGCLMLGSCIFQEGDSQLRWRACHPKIDVKGQGSQSDAQGMVFYCVRNVGAAKALLERALGSNGT